jgi:hypothetical protein
MNTDEKSQINKETEHSKEQAAQKKAQSGEEQIKSLTMELEEAKKLCQKACEDFEKAKNDEKEATKKRIQADKDKYNADFKFRGIERSIALIRENIRREQLSAGYAAEAAVRQKQREERFKAKALNLGLDWEKIKEKKLNYDQLREIGIIPDYCKGDSEYRCLSCQLMCNDESEYFAGETTEEIMNQGFPWEVSEQCQIIFVSSSKQNISCREAYKHYCELCEKFCEEPPVGERELGKAIAANFPEVKRIRKRINGELMYVYKGLNPRYNTEEGKEFFQKIQNRFCV